MTKKDRTSSPQWERLFGVPQASGMPLQAALRQAVVQAILKGQLSPGAALPSSRELSTLLGLSRNTVTAAYQQLMDDGYLGSRPRSGVFIEKTARLVPVELDPALQDPYRIQDSEQGTATDWSIRSLRQRVRDRTLTKPERWQDYPYPFVYGASDEKYFPMDGFRECCSLSVSRAQMPNWTHDLENTDLPNLVEQIRQRLLPQRGVFALPEEILITVGSQNAFYLLAEVLMDATTRVGLEEPGHPHARNSFSGRSPVFTGIPVDHDGMVVDGLPSLDYVFVTPSHQSPTTYAMSLERRQWLLRKAEVQNFAIIEDDYEAENLYAGTPLPALKSLDKTGRVIYVGSISKSLSPALRLGYIVASKELIAELRRARHAMLRHPSVFLQHSYALFLSLGHHENHARRINQEMLQRLSCANESLQRHLPEFTCVQPRGGASLWVQGPSGLDATALAVVAQQYGVLIEGGDVFFMQPPTPCSYFRLRISSIALHQIDRGIEALARAVANLRDFSA